MSSRCWCWFLLVPLSVLLASVVYFILSVCDAFDAIVIFVNLGDTFHFTDVEKPAQSGQRTEIKAPVSFRRYDKYLREVD